MKESIFLKTSNEIKIMSNPIRIRVIKSYHKYGKPATVKQIAGFMGEVPANIHYHVKKLLEINVLELHHTESVNGIIAKYYLPTAKYIEIEDLPKLDSKEYTDEKEVLISNMFDDIKTEFIKALKNKTDDRECILTSSVINLTEEEYNDITTYIKDVIDRSKNNDNTDKEPYLFLNGLIQSK